MASARPKKKGGEAGRSAARHFSVIVEDLLSQFKVFGEALQGLRENMAVRFDGIDHRFDGVDHRFERIDDRFDGVDHRFERIDGRFDGIDHRFERIDDRFDGIDHRFERIDDRFDGIDHRFDGIDGRFDGIDQEILLLKDASLTHTRELKEVNHQLREIRTSVDRLAEKVDQKVDRTEVEAIVERALSRP
jgi:archaellum component FlaC